MFGFFVGARRGSPRRETSWQEGALIARREGKREREVQREVAPLSRRRMRCATNLTLTKCTQAEQPSGGREGARGDSSGTAAAATAAGAAAALELGLDRESKATAKVFVLN